MSSTSVQFSVAIHIMAALAYYDSNGISSSKLAESVRAEPTFVRKSLSKLAKAGLVVTTRGKHGHCSLARNSKDITLKDIYNASESPVSFAVHKYDSEQSCPVSVNIQPCIYNIQAQVQRSLEQALQTTTLADLLNDLREHGRTSTEPQQETKAAHSS